MKKKPVLLLGKLPPPYFGPAVATQIILNSSIHQYFNLVFFETKLNESVATIGRFGFSKIGIIIRKYFAYFRLLKSEKPQVVLVPISQSTMGFLKDAVFIWLAALSGAKVLLHLRGSAFLNWYNSTSTATKWFTRKTLNRTSGVIVLGKSLTHLFASFYKPEQIFVVPNGGNFTIPQLEKTKTIITYIANFHRTKGFDVFLQALASLTNEERDKIEIHALGQWSQPDFKEACEKTIEANKLNIHFHTPDSGQDKFELLGKSSVFVFTPTAPEGHPWVIVEAMAAGLPIIATDQGAIKESVIDGINGFVIPSGNSQLLNEKLRLLINDAELRQKMAANSKQLYNEHFTEEKMIVNLVNVINTIISQ